LPTNFKLALVLSAFILASCSTIGGKETSNLIGRWRSTDQRHTAEYAFFPNSTFNGSVTGDGVLVSQFTGNWSFRDSAILYQYTFDKMGRIPPGTKDRDKVISISRDQFVIEAADGSRRKYIRVAHN
jgi:hypothetical protein